MSGTRAKFRYSCWDFFFTFAGLPLFLLDIVLDVLAAVSFYQEKAFVYLGVLLLFLVGSSLLAQAYSWLWYSYDNFEMNTKIEKLPSRGLLRLLHVSQLGIYFRHAGVLEMAVQSLRRKKRTSRENGVGASCEHGARPDSEGLAVSLSHDLSMLRIIEAFSESAPQLTLMLTIFLQRGQLDPVTVLKAVGSASAIAFTMTTYHRSLRSFLPEKKKQKIASSAVYFSWNLLLISSRLAALALFASVLPCFIFTHFICSWLVLFFFAWRSKTDFMDGPGGEWLYRATVGLIWYFDWFNVVEGNTRNRTVLYHGYILTDISVLCGVWCWKMSTDPPEFVIQPLYALITVVCVVGVYILGLLIKVIYYKCFHPNLDKDELRGQPEDEVDFRTFRPPTEASAHCNKRMRKMAVNFYCQPASFEIHEAGDRVM
ncbi:XK-related protein 8-like [Archocentrus centrarchus]|uniref:XK-related protein 8-like n=1 Tax=Archocentrus centrarchus TaxID=63155 RepID=UPI0011EA252F|nr:XK-related protein 8-like [Archocentrus centrarchus]